MSNGKKSTARAHRSGGFADEKPLGQKEICRSFRRIHRFLKRVLPVASAPGLGFYQRRLLDRNVPMLLLPFTIGGSLLFGDPSWPANGLPAASTFRIDDALFAADPQLVAVDPEWWTKCEVDRHRRLCSKQPALGSLLNSFHQVVVVLSRRCESHRLLRRGTGRPAISGRPARRLGCWNRTIRSWSMNPGGAFAAIGLAAVACDGGLDGDEAAMLRQLLEVRSPYRDLGVIRP